MKREVADSLGLLLVAVGVSLIVVPLVNVGLTVYPFKPADYQWRFGAWGFLLGALTLPLLGVGMAGIGSVLRGSRLAVVLVIVVAAAFLVLVVVGLFDFNTTGTRMRALAEKPEVDRLYFKEIRKTSLIAGITLPGFAAYLVAANRIKKSMVTAEADGPQSALMIGKR